MQRVVLHIAVHELNAGWGAETFLASALEGLGNKVIRLDYRAHFSELPEYLARITTESPDIILLQRGERFPIHLLTQLKMPKIYYATEGAWNPDQKEILESGAFDAYIASSHSTFQYMIQNCGVISDKAYHIPSGFDNDTYYRLAIEKRYDVVAVCNWSSRRRKAFWSLGCQVRNKRRFTGLYGSECNAVVNQSHVTLNIHGTNTLDTETRLFELLPTDTAIVSEECDSPELFENSGIQWFMRGDWAEMRRLVKMLLINKPLRKECIQRNNALAHQHTWQARSVIFNQLIEKLVEGKCRM